MADSLDQIVDGIGRVVLSTDNTGQQIGRHGIDCVHGIGEIGAEMRHRIGRMACEDVAGRVEQIGQEIAVPVGSGRSAELSEPDRAGEIGDGVNRVVEARLMPDRREKTACVGRAGVDRVQHRLQQSVLSGEHQAVALAETGRQRADRIHGIGEVGAQIRHGVGGVTCQDVAGRVEQVGQEIGMAVGSGGGAELSESDRAGEAGDGVARAVQSRLLPDRGEQTGCVGRGRVDRVQHRLEQPVLSGEHQAIAGAR